MYFSIGEYKDKVLCDIVDMDAFHLLLGLPWKYDLEAQHDGKNNTYTIHNDGAKYTMKLLKARNINPRRGNNSLIWVPSKIGHYNPKNGYRVLVSNTAQDQLDILKKLFWSSKVIPKVGIFAWLAYQRKILTVEKFTKMGYA